MENQSIVMVVSGPSGVGKSTVVKEFIRRHPDFQNSVSVTTRVQRPQETEGKDYYFKTQEEFMDMLAKGDILEFDQFDGNYYGTPKPPIQQAYEQGEHIIFELTVKGALSVKKNFPGAISIFLMPPSMQALYRRLHDRGTQTSDSMLRRMTRAQNEILSAKQFDFVVRNAENDLEHSISQLEAIAEAERLRYRMHAGMEDEILADYEEVLAAARALGEEETGSEQESKA